MNELEFRIRQFDNLVPELLNKRVVIYGTGLNAKKIIEDYPQLQIVGVLEKEISCRYVFGKRNLKIEDLISLKVEAVVIASQIKPLAEIYERICSFCHSNHIEVYDMYGDNLFELFFRLKENQSTLCQRNARVLKDEIAKYDIITIDLFQTLLNSEVGFRERIWWKIAKEHKEVIADPAQFVEIRGEAERRVEHRESRNSLSNVYDEIQKTIAISEEQKNFFIETEKKKIVQNLFLSSELVEILEYARNIGKEVWLISDLYFSESEIATILEQLKISAYDKILSAKDLGCNKYNGLFRIVDREGKKWIHIGEDETADGICPMIHGGDICLIEKADGLEKESPYYDVFQKIIEWYRGGKVNELIQYGCDSLYNSIVRTEMQNPFHYSVADDCKECEKQGILRLEKLKFTECENPVVSIIIPVYNQFLYTYNCLHSILMNTKGISYEVIIADDCSADATTYMEDIVEGIRVLHNRENLRFLKNCNNAAKTARGKYILFLNNDTYVQENWLKELLSLAENDEKIGMVGSKLIYPDGMLQEAGGIVWKDASAWNFGHGQAAGAPIYNYVREVDYISGASIMIRKSLWDKIGGFDERFAPAYYEDTDLAFQVRKNGFKVVYNPFSVVVHFEGVSNGTDLTNGQKAYQVANREKFYQKWEMVLRRDHFENGEKIFLAKDRSREKKHILVVDHYVPQHDHDAGGRCTYMYLKVFLKMGMQVSFIGDNYAYSVPYTPELLKMGIEILYGSYYKNHIEEWMQQNLQYFDIVYLQRPHISIKYIDMVKKYSMAKIFYFAHDLHHIRLKRQYELTGEKENLIEANKWKSIELELFQKADVGHVVGDFEQKYIQEIYPDKPIRNIPLYIFEEPYKGKKLSFEERKDIFYVGGFGHPPNIDAVMWFANEIFPTIVEKYPDIKWHIAGHNPTEEIIQLAGDNIIVEGFVSDKKLEELYNICRLAVVPLRVGAGVKGKIVEAAYYQVPVVTTDIGAEGISREENALIVENDANAMAERICSLYENFTELEEYSKREKSLIENHYLLKNAIDVLQEDMDL